VVCTTHACDAFLQRKRQQTDANCAPCIRLFLSIADISHATTRTGQVAAARRSHCALHQCLTSSLVCALAAHNAAAGAPFRSAPAGACISVLISRRHAKLALVAAPVLAAAQSSPLSLLQSTQWSTSEMPHRCVQQAAAPGRTSTAATARAV
jgi:hypothetical protein